MPVATSSIGNPGFAVASSQLLARLAGLFYVGTIGFGLFAEVVARQVVRGGGDAPGMMAALAGHEELYRAGAVADLATLGCYIAVTALLYGLLAPRAPQLSLHAAFFSLIGIAVLAANGLLHLLPLALADGAGHGGLPAAFRQELADLALEMHGRVYGISLVFFGVYCVLIGWTAARSGLVPWAVGALMIVGGACHLITKTAGIAAPAFARELPDLMNLAPLIGEAVLAGWLLIFGAGRISAALPAARTP